MKDEAMVERRSAGPGLPVWVAAIVLVSVVALASLALALTLDRGDATYPADSPEAAFSAYAQAWGEGDTETAYAVLSERAQTTVSEWRFRDANRWSGEDISRIWIHDRTGTDDRAVLALTVETSYSEGIFGSDRYREDSRVVLVREHDNWKIDTPLVGYFAW
jgi:hypothetical protein